MIPARILGTASVLPGRAVTTQEVIASLGRKDDGRYEKKTGIRTRHWVEPGTPLAPSCAEAVAQALEVAGLQAKDLRRIILARAGSGDLQFPATANRVAARLGLSGSCDCFDVENACMGFLTAFDIAARSVATGLGPVAVIGADFTSRGIRPSEHRPYLVFGDAIGAAIVGPARPNEGIVESFYGNDGTLPDDVYALEPSLTGEREFVRFAMNSGDIFEVAFRAMATGIRGVLERARTNIRDVEWIVAHQPNGAMLDLMIERLEMDPERMVRVVHEIGSVAAASLPVCLDRLLKTKPVRPGDRILFAGVGGGVSYGAALYRVGGDS